jgi:hypothetical protein
MLPGRCEAEPEVVAVECDQFSVMLAAPAARGRAMSIALGSIGQVMSASPAAQNDTGHCWRRLPACMTNGTAFCR